MFLYKVSGDNCLIVEPWGFELTVVGPAKSCQEDIDGADWLRPLKLQMSQPRRIFMSKGPAQECITHPPPALAFTAGR